MISYENLQEEWQAKGWGKPRHRAPALTDEGLVLGAGTVLLKRAAGEGQRLAIDGEEARILALLSVAYDRAVPVETLGNIRRAAKAYGQGEEAQALIHLAHGGLGKLEDGEETPRRLFMAERMLAAGVEPGELLKGLGLDDAPLRLLKGYNPDEPRVPKGSPGGGQWTRAGDSPRAASSPEIRVAQNDTVMTDAGHISQPVEPIPLKLPDGTIFKDPNSNSPILMPSSASLSENIRIGKELATLPPDEKATAMVLLFYWGGSMDYQRMSGRHGPVDLRYRDFGNFNFGVVSAAASYTREEALFYAGMFHRFSTEKNDKPGAWGNSPRNAHFVEMGYDAYVNGLLNYQDSK